jgi:hypothetical protein
VRVCKAYNSVSQRDVLESKGTRSDFLRISMLILRNVVLADTARAVEGERESGQATMHEAFAAQTGDIRDARDRRAVLANGRVGRQGVHAATTFAPDSLLSFRDNAGREWRHLQLSRSRAASTHSHERGPPPRTPQATHPGPISEQAPLPTQLLFLTVGALEGHAPGATHWPLQTIEGALHTHLVGCCGGKGVNPSSHVNPQGSPLMQAGLL